MPSMRHFRHCVASDGYPHHYRLPRRSFRRLCLIPLQMRLAWLGTGLVAGRADETVRVIEN